MDWQNWEALRQALGELMKYTKRPIPVHAEQFREIWGISGEGSVTAPDCVVRRWFRTGWWIKTLEGWYRVNLGDYIITGVKGEKYPCRKDIFEITYKPTL